MELLTTDETPIRYSDVVFREARGGKLIAFVLFLALTLAALTVGLVPEAVPANLRLPGPAAFFVAAGLAIFALVSLYSLRAALRRSNWLVRFDGSDLYIKFRSYLNHHFPAEDRVVVRIPAAEVAWIRKTRERRRLPRRRGADARATTTYLDVRLQADTGELKRQLAKERKRQAPMVRRTRTKAEHYPVRVIGGDIVRIDWRDHRTRITPGIDAALDKLGRCFRVREAESLTQEPVGRSSDRRQQEDRLLDLVERGEMLAATRLAARLYDLSATEAKELVEGLAGGPGGGEGEPDDGADDDR